jgi:hypothetical protein
VHPDAKAVRSQAGWTTMSSEGPLVLRLEVDRDTEPITGTLSQPGHPKRSFTGWLALTDVIESIRAAENEQSPKPWRVSDEPI